MRGRVVGRRVAVFLVASAVALGTMLHGVEVASAQEPTPDASRAEVVEAVRGFFDALAAKDTAALRAAFHPDATLTSVADEGGPGAVAPAAVDDFLRSIGSAGAELHEAIGEVEVRIDGPLATVWTPYTFYVDGSPSHCGVNAFDLVRIGRGWVVLHVSDTRRRDGCDGDVAAPAGARR